MSENFICTVLVVTYNHAKTISRALDSILEQKTSYKFKISIFDDASKDGSADIIQKYAEDYPDIVFPNIAPQNLGAQGNYWRAFCSVDTPYFVILEGDDLYCDSHKLQLQIDALEEHPNCSFCGHDTYLFSEDESYQEYENGSRAMTAPMLKTKNIFTFNDFKNITTGGYIPYCSARMIRTSTLKLDEIKYKEAVLFDFTQFYYLLLQGDYYYIDLPMSAYVRNGHGVCSGKSPMAFLDDFIQAAIDFNRQTNDVIADKIYSDCILQIKFRTMLHQDSEWPLRYSIDKKNGEENALNIEKRKESSLYYCQSGLSKDTYYYLCNGGLGHTMLVCAYKNALEEHLGKKVVLMVTSEQAFIPAMYGIDEVIEVDLTDINCECLSSCCPNPMPGKVYVTHPFAHSEATNYYNPIYQLYSSVPYLPWLLEFMGLPTDMAVQLPKKIPDLAEETQEKIKNFGSIKKIVLLFPEANAIACISKRIWKNLAKDLTSQGLTVLSCVVDKRHTIAGTHYVDLDAEQCVALGMRCHSVYCMRNGMAELLSERGQDLHVFYPSHSTFFIYSINRMLGRKDIQEKIELELEPQQGFAVSSPAAPSKPKFLGIIRVPNWAYQFYLRHKKYLQFFKRFIKWKP